MKNKFIGVFLLLSLIFTKNKCLAQIIYQHDFGTATFTAVNPYGVPPTTIDANLNTAQWLTSLTAGYNSLAGSIGQALSINNSGGTPTYSLSFNVASGFNCDITAFSFWRQRSATGAQNWTLTVNGNTTIGTGTVPTTGANTGTIAVSNPANGLSGTVNVVLQLSDATGTGTFRLDDFTLYGSVYSTSTCTPPTSQATIFSTSNIGNNSATISWTSGNGGKAIVLARQSAAVNSSPVSSLNYTANSSFGIGQQIGIGNYVVFDGIGNSVNVTGLNANTTYYFSVFEYNTTTGTPCYLTPALTGSITTTSTTTPGTCIEIKSILVAACGAPESYNEMVYFKNGPNPLPINQLSIAGAPASGVYALNKWPNNSNSWFGIVQNTLTASNVNTINNFITKCGVVLEPPLVSGVGTIPANANVILVGHQSMNPSANSFANLTDTVYMIFQAASTSTAGNFTNSGTGTRGFVLIDNLHGCTSNSITYTPTSLATGGNNGDAISFDLLNNITYYNNGCQAPYIPLAVNAGLSQTICYNSQAVLTATPSSVYNSLIWSGGTGTFSSPTSLTTTYTPGALEVGTVTLQCTITRSCAASTYSVSDIVNISILSLPTFSINASNGYSLCPSAFSVLSYSVTNAANSGVITPSWSSPSSSGTTYTVSAPTSSNPETYSLSLTNICGNAVETFTVFPLALPTISLSSSSPTACAGSTVVLSAISNTGNYNWNNSASTNSNVVISSNTTTTGIVTTTNTCGSVSENYTLTVIQFPTISVNNPNVNLCTGQSAIVTATSSEGNYFWQPGGINTNSLVVNSNGVYTVTTSNSCFTSSTIASVSITASPSLFISSSTNSLCTSGQNNTTLNLSGSTGSYVWNTGASSPSISISTPGVYTATVTTPSCGSAVADYTVTAIPDPTVTIASSSFTVCPGNTVNLTAISSEGNYLWSGFTSTTSSLSLTAFTSTTGVVTTTNICNSATSNYTINVIPSPTLTVDFTSINLCTGQSATITATSSEGNYLWQPSGINTNSLVINSVGIYSVTTSNLCFTTTASTSVTVNSLPTLSISSTSSSLCASGQTATLSLSGSTGTYLWSNGGNSSTTTINTPGVYTATVNTPSCGSASTSINVGTSPLPIVSISAPTTTLCSGSALTFTANSSDANYLWPGGITTQTVSVNTSSIVVTTTNACGSAQATQTINIIPIPSVSLSSSAITLCSGQSATVQANSNTPVTYSWSTGVNTNTVSLNTVGVYTVNVSNACGVATATVDVTISALPNIAASASQTLLCPGQSSLLALTGSVGTYLWSNGATTATTSVTNAGIYTGTVTTSCGSAVSSVTIATQVTPTISVSASAFTICSGQSSTLTASSNVTNYSWSNGSFNNTTVVNTSGIFTVSVSNNCGIATETINITTSTLPVLIITPSSVLICPNETATLTVSGGSEPYSWSNSSSTGSVVVTNGGTVTVSNTNACGTSSAITVVNVTNLNADFTANPVSGTLPVVVSFTNNSTGANSFAWNFGNGNSASSQNVSAETYSAVGVYTVYLTAFNGSCSDTYSLIINVFNEETTLVVPNVFTPNGDGSNDVYRISGKNITEFNCTIYDRWGLQMYYWDDIRNGWDGTNGNKMVPDGTYFYIIHAKDLDNKEIKRQGFLQLFQ